MSATKTQLLSSGEFCKLRYDTIKVNQSHYRPGVAQRVPGSLRFPDFMTTAEEGGKVFSLTDRPLLPPGNYPGTHFC